MEEVDVQPEWREKADRYAREVGYPSMRTGKLAEYAVIWFFRKNGVQVREDQTPTTQPDYLDINLGNTLVDVKSCLEPAQEVRVTKKYFDMGRRFAFYIGVQVSKDRKKARIFGFCSLEDVKKARSRHVGNRVVYSIPFSQLQPIQKLVSSFRKDWV